VTLDPVTLDAGAREIITRRGLGRTLFVEAGAGTGKTTQLVGRIANLVVDEGVPLAGIAAITFTEAAAAELAARIRVTFERRAADSPDGEVRDRCRAAIADADRAAISTLHSFASRILGEHPLAAGLPPRIGILDEINSQLAHEERWDRFVEELYDDPDHEGLLIRAALADVALEPRYRGHVTMKGVAVRLAQSWDRLDDAVGRDHGPLPPLEFGPFDRAAAAAEALLVECRDHDDYFYRHLTRTVMPKVRTLRAITDPDRKFRALRRQRDWGPERGGTDGGWPGGIAAAKGIIAALNDAKAAVVTPAVNDVLDRLLTLVSREVLGAAEARRLEGQLEFHDLLVLARRLLRTSPPARRALHGRYTHLLLDEFQDTDPIQIELAVLIAAAVAGDDPPEWGTADVEPGRLFFVGDPKQSIYRFRRADIELFLKARDRFGADDACLRLTTNFRTVPPVLDWVNGIFGRLMPDEVAGKQPRYEPLDAHRGPSPGGDHRPLLLGGPHDKARAGELREFEAGDVARTVDHIRTDPEAWPVLEEKTGEWRPARLTDVTILLPTRTSLPYLRAALDGRDIPYRLNTGTLVYDTQEVHDALAALRAVDDPTDELSLVTALRSPLYACADTDLFTFHHAGGRWDLRRREPPEGIAADHPVPAALAHLRSLWEQRWWLRPSVLLDRLLEERSAFVLAFGEGRAPEVWGRLRFLVDQARAFEEAGGGGLRAFLDWADLQRSESAGVHEPMLPETDDDAVRIMTIHGAKGLEFPITVVSGMTTKPAGRRGGVSVVWNEDGTPEVRLRKDIGTANHDPRADLEAEMDVHEKLRLLYVACTRARDHLVVAAHHQKEDRSYACTVWKTTQDQPDTWRALPAEDEDGPAVMPPTTAVTPAALPDRPTTVAVTATAPAEDEHDASLAAREADDGREAWLAAREALLAPQRRPRFVSATAIAREAGVGAVDEERDPDDLAGAGGITGDADLPVAPRRRGRAGTAIGRAVHATLQFTDLAASTGLEAQAARQAELEAVPEHASMIAAMARSALASDAVQLAARSVSHKEIYVAAPFGDRVIEGYIDLLVETPEGLVIVDYKTDTLASEADVDAKLATYELQGAAYAVALEVSTGMPVVDCRFVFCRPSGAIERRVADLDSAKGRVRAHLVAARD
jgi:ATP-dependent helicase/nuclease subunit A